MKEDPAEKAFVDRVKKALDAGTEELDSTLEARLNQARKEALAWTDPKQKPFRSRRPFRWWADWRIAGAAAACTLVLVLGILVHRPAAPPANILPVDMKMLAETQDPEVYEDLEFYHWLSRMKKDAG